MKRATQSNAKANVLAFVPSVWPRERTASPKIRANLDIGSSNPLQIAVTIHLIEMLADTREVGSRASEIRVYSL